MSNFRERGTKFFLDFPELLLTLQRFSMQIIPPSHLSSEGNEFFHQVLALRSSRSIGESSELATSRWALVQFGVSFFVQMLESCPPRA